MYGSGIVQGRFSRQRGALLLYLTTLSLLCIVHFVYYLVIYYHMIYRHAGCCVRDPGEGCFH